jgi:hypothetical protein
MSREAIEEDLIAAERRAAAGRFQIQRQRDAISDLERRERDTTAAQAVLAALVESQTALEKNAQRLLRELDNYDAKHGTA